MGLARYCDVPAALSIRFFVLRDGKTEELPLAEIVVGDVAEFKYGNTFPVDGVLIKVRSVIQPHLRLKCVLSYSDLPVC